MQLINYLQAKTFIFELKYKNEHEFSGVMILVSMNSNVLGIFIKYSTICILLVEILIT